MFINQKIINKWKYPCKIISWGTDSHADNLETDQ